MGANGFLWVHSGAGGSRGTKASQAGGFYGHADPDLGAMAGEISPDMTFFVFCQKWLIMSADGS